MTTKQKLIGLWPLWIGFAFGLLISRTHLSWWWQVPLIAVFGLGVWHVARRLRRRT